MIKTLVNKQGIEAHGFGSFSLNYPAPLTDRNPKAGDAVNLSAYVPHFKHDKNLRHPVNSGA